MSDAPTVPMKDGWIEWHGGENPAPGKLVDAEFGSAVMINCLSDILGDGWKGPGRYRVVSAPLEEGGSLRASPSVPTEGHEAAVVALKIARDMLAAGSDRSLIIGHLDDAMIAATQQAVSPPEGVGVVWRDIASEPRVHEIGHLWLAADAAGRVFPGVFVGHRIPADATKVMRVPAPDAIGEEKGAGE